MNRVKSIGATLLIVAVCAVAIEVLFRFFVLPQDFLYIESSYSSAPRHRLVPHHDSGGIQIEDRRRVVPHGAARSGKIAIVGDSVAFGSGLADRDVLANLIQAKQTRFDVENYGVPGYGLRDYIQVIGQLPERTYDIILVDISANDPYPASAGRLGLLVDGDGATVLFNDYAEGRWEKIKVFLFRYAKSLYFTANVLNAIRSGEGNAITSGVVEETYREDGGIKCPADIEQQVQQSSAFTRSFETQRRIYGDPVAQKKLTDDFAKLKAVAATKAARLIVFKNYDYVSLTRGVEPYRGTINAILGTLGIETFDADYEQHRINAGACGYFADPGHPGPLYNQTLADLLIPVFEPVLGR